MKNTTILTAVAGFLTWALIKVNKLINAGKQISIEKIKVQNLHYDWRNTKQITFMLQVKLLNPTKEKFPIKVKRVDIYDLTNRHITTAIPPGIKFELQPNSTYDLKDVAVYLPSENIGHGVFHGLREQLNAIIMLEVHGINIKLNQLITYTK